MEVLPYFSLIYCASNIVSQLTDLTFSCCMFFSKEIALLSKMKWL